MIAVGIYAGRIVLNDWTETNEEFTPELIRDDLKLETLLSP